MPLRMKTLILLVAVIITGCAGLPQSLPPHQFTQAVRAGEYGGYNSAHTPPGGSENLSVGLTNTNHHKAVNGGSLASDEKDQ